MNHRAIKFNCPYCQGWGCKACKFGVIETTYRYHGKFPLSQEEGEALDKIVAAMYKANLATLIQL